MGDHERADLDHDPRFPSGPWVGFFLVSWLPGRHSTNLRMVCQGGQLQGTGEDWVGPYAISGTYDSASGKCTWTKRYVGKHTVEYRGVNDGRGIWGVWEIRQFGGLWTDRGGFHLWPEGVDVSEDSDQTERAVLAVMREEFGGRSARAGWGLLLLGILVALALMLRWAWVSS